MRDERQFLSLGTVLLFGLLGYMLFVLLSGMGANAEIAFLVVGLSVGCGGLVVFVLSAWEKKIFVFWLVLSSLIVFASAAVNYDWSASGGGLQYWDAMYWYRSGIRLSELGVEGIGRELFHASGYPVVLAGLVGVFGERLEVLYITSAVLVSSGFVFIGLAAVHGSGNWKVGQATAAVQLATPVLIVVGSSIGQDALVVFGLSVGMWGCAAIAGPGADAKGRELIGGVGVALSVMILASTRPILGVIPIVLLAASIEGVKRRVAYLGLVCLPLAMIGINVAAVTTESGFGLDQVLWMLSSWNTYSVGSEWEQGVSRMLFHGYSGWPVWKRVLMLPAASALLFLKPFPLALESVGPPFEITWKLANIIWILLIGPLLTMGTIWSLKLNRVKKAYITRLAFLGVMAFLGLAYINVGSDPRYLGSVVPLFLPLGGLAVVRICEDWRVRLQVTRWLLAYLILLAIAVACYLIAVAHL